MILLSLAAAVTRCWTAVLCTNTATLFLPPMYTPTLHPRTPLCRPAEASRSSSGGSSSAFGGAQFWGALRGVDKLEGEVRALFTEARASTRRRGGQPLLVESDLKLARFLAGLHVSAGWGWGC